MVDILTCSRWLAPELRIAGRVHVTAWHCSSGLLDLLHCHVKLARFAMAPVGGLSLPVLVAMPSCSGHPSIPGRSTYDLLDEFRRLAHLMGFHLQEPVCCRPSIATYCVSSCQAGPSRPGYMATGGKAAGAAPLLTALLSCPKFHDMP